MTRISQAQLGVLMRVNGGAKNSPPLPRTICDALEDLGYIRRYRGGFFITQAGRQVITERVPRAK